MGTVLLAKPGEMSTIIEENDELPTDAPPACTEAAAAASEAICSSQGLEINLEPVSQEQAVDKAVVAAASYLSAHNLELRLGDAMQALLNEKPEDPVAYLIRRLQKNA